MAIEQSRVFLWCTPRSVSTAFVRSMENVPNVEIFVEPFLVAHHFGPERRMIGLDPDQKVEDEFTYELLQKKLEGTFSDKKVIFVKDMGYAIHEKFEYIPKGYKHCILIRDPLKSFVSYFKQISKTKPEIDLSPVFRFALPSGLWYKELCDLVEHLEQQGNAPLIIDADDLIAQPDVVMKEFCKHTEIPFSTALLSWNGQSRVKWNMAQTLWDLHHGFDWHKTTFQTTSFDQSASKNGISSNDIPESVHQCAEESMPYYNQLYKKRVQL